jgi:ParB-like chromosome segregation protein Spo0J
MKVSIKEIKPNPNNPRLVKDDKFAKLVKSIKDFPQMLDIRPIVVNKDMIVLGGNMRLKACKEAGLKEIPIIKAEDLTEEQQREFIIKDNVGYGEWDWELIAKEWDTEKLNDWGLDIPDFAIAPTEDELIADEKNKPPTIKITFESVEDLQQAEIDITELIDRKYPKAYFSVSAGEL